MNGILFDYQELEANSCCRHQYQQPKVGNAPGAVIQHLLVDSLNQLQTAASIVLLGLKLGMSDCIFDGARLGAFEADGPWEIELQWRSCGYH